MAITKIQSGAIPADTIDTTHIGDVGADKITGQVVSSQISDLSVTHAKLHTDMDLSSKTVTLPSAITNTITNKLPLAGGSMTGALIIADTGTLDIRMGTDKRVTWSGALSEIGSVAGFQATNTAGSALSSFGMRGTDLRFATGSEERMRINDTGVGIGTSNPSQILHLESSSSRFLIKSTAADEASMNFNTPSGNTYIGLAGSNGELFSGSAAGDFVISNRSGGDIHLTADTGFVESHFTIIENGYVGIGNNTPGYHIDARGGSSTGDGMRVKTGDNGYDGLIVSSSAILKCYPAQGQSVSLQAYNSGGSTKTGVKVTGFDTPAGEISTKLEFVTEMLGHNVYDSNDYGTSNDQYVDLEDWTPNDFRILEIFGTVNPNSGGSGSYADPVHMYVYNGSGWNGAEVTYYVYGKSVAPLARDMYTSGSGSSANVAEVWWYNSSTTAQQDAATHNTASGYHLRLKFPNTNASFGTGINLKVIKRA